MTRKPFMYNCSHWRIDIIRSSVNLKKVSLFIIILNKSMFAIHLITVMRNIYIYLPVD